MDCDVDLGTRCAALLVVAADAGWALPSVDNAVNVGVRLLEAGCEQPSVLQLASSPTGKGRSWGALRGLFYRVMADVGIDTSPDQATWAVIRWNARHVISLTDVRELGSALRALTFHYWDWDLRHDALDRIMAELHGLDDEWERTVPEARRDLIGKLKSLGQSLVDLSEAGLKGEIRLDKAPTASAPGREGAMPVAATGETVTIPEDWRQASEAGRVSEHNEPTLPADTTAQNVLLSLLSKLLDWVKG